MAAAGGGRSAAQTVVLVLLLGLFAVVVGLSGRDMLELTRQFTTRQDLDTLRTLVLLYRTRHGALPGDDPRGVAGGKAAAEVTGVRGNGRWDGPALDLARPERSEAVAAWADLARAGLWQPDEDRTASFAPVPHNRFGGLTLFADGLLGLGPSLCLTSVPAADALRLDARMDDGDPATGAVRAGLPEDAETAAGAAAVNRQLRTGILPSDGRRAVVLCLDLAAG